MICITCLHTTQHQIQSANQTEYNQLIIVQPIPTKSTTIIYLSITIANSNTITYLTPIAPTITDQLPPGATITITITQSDIINQTTFNLDINIIQSIIISTFQSKQ